MVSNNGHNNFLFCFSSFDWIISMASKVKPNGICRSGCPTQDHDSYGECIQSANIGIDKTSLRP